MGFFAKLIDRDLGMLDFIKRIREVKDARVHVGVLADDSKGGAREGDLTVAEIAAILEYGTKDGHIPARPFLRHTFDAHREEMEKIGEKLIGQAVDGKITVDKALGIMGAKLSAEVKKCITSGPGVPPPNAPSTIKAKGSSRPLVDTGRLVNAITWAIVPAGEKEK